jgi:hypothetical protein
MFRDGPSPQDVGVYVSISLSKFSYFSAFAYLGFVGFGLRHLTLCQWWMKDVICDRVVFTELWALGTLEAIYISPPISISDTTTEKH